MTRHRRNLLGVLLLIIIATPGCSTMRAWISGFEPIWPQQRYNPYNQSLEVPLVSLNRPTLSWAPFPGIEESSPGIGAFFGLPRKSPFVDVDLDKVGSVTYQLRIWNVENDTPTEIFYDRSGIEDTSHRVDKRLRSGRVYFWSVRAEFVYEGKTRLTAWSIVLGRKLSRNYYRFRARNL